MHSLLHPVDIHQILASDDAEFRAAFRDSLAPPEAADVIDGLEPGLARELLGVWPVAERAEIVSYLDAETQSALTTILPRAELAAILTEMSADDRVDFLRHMPDERREQVLPALAQAEREDIRRLMAYPEGTAGSVMTSEYVTLPATATVREAIDLLRAQAPNKETIYYAYVLDESRRLRGFVSLKDLIVNVGSRRIEEIMHEDFVHARADEDQEVAARTIQRYDLLALPVLDDGSRLVGIITHDDALDVITQEHTEDMEKLMAIGGAHEVGTYLHSTAWENFRNRVGWIVALAALGLVSGSIVQRFEGALTGLIVLAFYMPMLADTGGNTGSQSATVVVRALALGEIGPGDAVTILLKELRVGLLLALVLGCLTLLRVLWLTDPASVSLGLGLPRVGFAIALALSLQVTTSTVVGAALPLMAARFGLDPALVASPALTTVVDITGLLIYFTTASAVLGL